MFQFSRRTHLPSHYVQGFPPKPHPWEKGRKRWGREVRRAPSGRWVLSYLTPRKAFRTYNRRPLGAPGGGSPEPGRAPAGNAWKIYERHTTLPRHLGDRCSRARYYSCWWPKQEPENTFSKFKIPFSLSPPWTATGLSYRCCCCCFKIIQQGEERKQPTTPPLRKDTGLFSKCTRRRTKSVSAPAWRPYSPPHTEQEKPSQPSSSCSYRLPRIYLSRSINSLLLQCHWWKWKAHLSNFHPKSRSPRARGEKGRTPLSLGTMAWTLECGQRQSPSCLPQEHGKILLPK